MRSPNQRNRAMKLHVITTGGTIDKVYFDAKSDYQVGDPVIGELLTAMAVGFDFTVESAMRKDSLDMDDADRELIRKLASPPSRVARDRVSATWSDISPRNCNPNGFP